MGGTQFGIPLRGYEEFSITPNGFDPLAGAARRRVRILGGSYAAFSTELGARVSQSLYFDVFFDAGNVYRTYSQFDPSRLFRGVGVGAAVSRRSDPSASTWVEVDQAAVVDGPTPAGNFTSGWATSSNQRSP
jgi:outer membrane protein insertion porin family